MTPRAANRQGLLVAGMVPALAYARRAVKALQQREVHHHPLRAAAAAAWRLVHHAVAQLRGPSHVQVSCPPPTPPARPCGTRALTAGRGRRAGQALQMAVASPLLMLHPAGLDIPLVQSLFAHLARRALEPPAGPAAPADGASSQALAARLIAVLLAPGAPSRAPILHVLSPPRSAAGGTAARRPPPAARRPAVTSRARAPGVAASLLSRIPFTGVARGGAAPPTSDLFVGGFARLLPERSSLLSFRGAGSGTGGAAVGGALGARSRGDALASLRQWAVSDGPATELAPRLNAAAAEYAAQLEQQQGDTLRRRAERAGGRRDEDDRRRKVQAPGLCPPPRSPERGMMSARHDVFAT